MRGAIWSAVPVAWDRVQFDTLRIRGWLCYLLNASHRVGLRSLLPLNDVKFDFVAFLQTLVAIELDRAVMNKHVGPIVTADKAVSLRVIEPLHFAFMLGH
jgi:hypothetical protein